MEISKTLLSGATKKDLKELQKLLKMLPTSDKLLKDLKPNADDGYLYQTVFIKKLLMDVEEKLSAKPTFSKVYANSVSKDIKKRQK
jgi:hypothetical protein